MTDADHDFADFVDACSQALDTLALMALAYAQGRGSALAELAHVPSPSSSADRHARYSAGMRTPQIRRPAREAQFRREAVAWGWLR